MAIPVFGTDGIRGRAGHELNGEIARALGQAAAEILGGPEFVVGSDTRASGPALQAALADGLGEGGAQAVDLGVVPTPAVAWVSAQRHVPAAMISASHNPYHDNGIKLFAPGGLKLRHDVEVRIQDRYLELASESTTSARPNDAGRSADSRSPASQSPESQWPTELSLDRGASPTVDGWIDSVVASVGDQALHGMRLVIDCAHGAASDVGPAIFRRLGADVTAIGCEPDGVNINDGVGSTAPQTLARTVLELGADAGLAFDGDADRLIAVDETGHVVDGDRVLGLLATDWARQGRLRDNTVVVTVMTNLGFHRAMAAAGIKVMTTAVGDRYVLESLDDHRLSLGGEQSGHIICRELATTGDGVLAGVQLLDVVARESDSFAALSAAVMSTVPQLLENVRLATRNPGAGSAIADQVAAVEAEFGDDGRVVVRPSGTEPLLRIMVEHIDQATAEEACRRLVAEAERVLGTVG